MGIVQTCLEIRRDTNFGNAIAEILRKIRERRGTWCDRKNKKNWIVVILLPKLREKKFGNSVADT